MKQFQPRRKYREDDIVRCTYGELTDLIDATISCAEFEKISNKEALALVADSILGSHEPTETQIKSMDDQELMEEYTHIFFPFENGGPRHRKEARRMSIIEEELNRRGYAIKRKATIKKGVSAGVGPYGMSEEGEA